MVSRNQFTLGIKHHISVVLESAVRWTVRVAGVTRLLVSHVRHNIDGVVLGQAAESFLYTYLNSLEYFSEVRIPRTDIRSSQLYKTQGGP